MRIFGMFLYLILYEHNPSFFFFLQMIRSYWNFTIFFINLHVTVKTSNMINRCVETIYKLIPSFRILLWGCGVLKIDIHKYWNFVRFLVALLLIFHLSTNCQYTKTCFDNYQNLSWTAKIIYIYISWGNRNIPNFG